MFNNPSDNNDLQFDLDNQLQDGMKQNVNNYFLEVEGWKNPYILYPDDYKTLPELLNAFGVWWKRTRHMDTTIKKYIASIKRMSKHPVYPVDPWHLNYEQIINHLEYREHTEKVGPHGIRNDWKALKSLALSYGLSLENSGYVPPSPPPSKTRVLPLPVEVKKQISYKYSKDRVVNKTIQYILTHGYLFGYRPEEFPIQLVDNVKISDGYMIVIEAKKHYQIRQLFPEPELLTGDRRKSIKNLLKLHDEINPDSPFLYIQPNGKPWTVDYLRKWLCSYVKPVFPGFMMYNMRHWCATSRLIKSYISTGVWDKEDVKDWMGHDDLRTTDEYTKFAKKYYMITGYDWIRAILKAKTCQDNSLNQRTPQTLNTSNQSPDRVGTDLRGFQQFFSCWNNRKNLQFLSFFFSFEGVAV